MLDYVCLLGTKCWNKMMLMLISLSIVGPTNWLSWLTDNILPTSQQVKLLGVLLIQCWGTNQGMRTKKVYVLLFTYTLKPFSISPLEMTIRLSVRDHLSQRNFVPPSEPTNIGLQARCCPYWANRRAKSTLKRDELTSITGRVITWPLFMAILCHMEWYCYFFIYIFQTSINLYRPCSRETNSDSRV